MALNRNNNQKGRQNQRANGGKTAGYYNRKFWKLFLYSMGGVILFFLFASWGFFGAMPSFEELENPNSNLATEVISSDGVVIGKFYNENRSSVKYAELPQYLVKALVATEDERFYEHSGIDGRRTISAVLKLGTSGGASTLTQQLAKMLFHERSKNPIVAIVQKAKEWIIAVKLERQYTKNEIIAMYFNKVDFVNTAVGIRSAAKVYFGKEPRELTVDESAMLVGMLKNPSLFNPIRRPEKVRDRRNVVLGQMVRNKIITEQQKSEYEKLPITLNFQPESHYEGIATYFREYVRDFMKSWVKDNKKPDGSDYDIYRDGLKIYTTIDSRMQTYAEEAVTEHLSNLQEEFTKQQAKNKNAPFVNLSEAETERLMSRARKASQRWREMEEQGKSESEISKSFDVKTKMTVFTWKGDRDTIMTPNDSIRYYKNFLQTGMMAMEPESGHVKVWVGGINYKNFQYDHVGQGARQVGSTFKPIVYATAMKEMGMSPCDSIIDSPFTIPVGRHNVTETWTPNNANGRYVGMVTLKYALAQSINTVSAKLIDRTGPAAVISMAKKLGITTEIPEQPSIALGAVEVTVEQMVAAFSTFANKGVYVKPQLITRIEDKNGNKLFETVPVSHDVLDKDTSYAVIKLMQGVTESGSGARLRTEGGGFGYERVTGYPYVFKNPIAGKTGTSQNQSDGWFIGMVPNLAAGVWVGNEDRSAHFKSLAYGQGATTALPIWGLFMKKCYADETLTISKEDFERPADLKIKVDCYGGIRKKVVVDTTVVEEQSTDEFDL